METKCEISELCEKRVEYEYSPQKTGVLQIEHLLSVIIGKYHREKSELSERRYEERVIQIFKSTSPK